MADDRTTPGNGRQSGAYSASGQEATGSPDRIGHAITEVTQKIQVLVREEVELAKAEVGAKASKLGKGAAIGAAAGVFVLGALVLILHGFALLAWYLLFPDETYFWGYFMVAAILLLIAALAGLIARRALKAGSPPTPQMAIDEAKLIRETVGSKEPETTVAHPEARR